MRMYRSHVHSHTLCDLHYSPFFFLLFLSVCVCVCVCVRESRCVILIRLCVIYECNMRV